MRMIEQLLDAKQLIRLDEILSRIDDVDGRRTAGKIGARIKNNLQKRGGHPEHAAASQLVLDAMKTNRTLQTYAFPFRITPVRFAEYGPGMHYDEHMDAGVMPLAGGLLRTDISFTLFLSDPDSYEGGELTIIDDMVQSQVKGKRGDLFVYSSGLRHQVNEVRAGQRRVGVGWIQSLYPTAEQRRVMGKLGILRADLRGETDAERHSLANEVIVCLQRLWSDI